MDETIDNLFRLAQIWRPQEVGIETTGQQGAFISLIRNEMVQRNQFFVLAKGKDGNREGIPARNNKMERFRLTMPFWKSGKMYLPKDQENSALVQELLAELQMVTLDGIKAKHDDALDMVSQLEQMHLVLPDEYQANIGRNYQQDIFTDEDFGSETSVGHSTYVV